MTRFVVIARIAIEAESREEARKELGYIVRDRNDEAAFGQLQADYIELVSAD